MFVNKDQSNKVNVTLTFTWGTKFSVVADPGLMCVPVPLNRDWSRSSFRLEQTPSAVIMCGRRVQCGL